MQYFERAKKASQTLKVTDTDTKNKALLSIARALRENVSEILKANEIDIKVAKENGVTNMLDRLLLNEQRILSIANDVEKVVSLPDPVGEVIEEWSVENGLKIVKTRIPFGVIGIIYESRPNVTIDIASLCIKTGNVCVLKGGKDAVNTNTVLEKIVKDAIKEYVNPDCVILLPSTREWADKLITAKGYVDLVIPRGSKGLIQNVVQNAKVPVIETGAGVCHLYVEKTADLEQTLTILLNAKCQRPSVCNAVETLLVDREIADKFLPIAKKSLEEKGVILRGDSSVNQISVQELTENGYFAEYDSLNLSIKVVDGVKQAIEHISTFGTNHSECICTKDNKIAEYFLNNVDSACVYVNASTRFTDGGCFGFGAEIGISTQKLHARGPMGLREMTTYHYKIYGDGQVRK